MKKQSLGILDFPVEIDQNPFYAPFQEFYDDIFFIDPQNIYILYDKTVNHPMVFYKDRLLNKCSMIYLANFEANQRRNVTMMIHALEMTNTLLSHNLEGFIRHDIGKGYESIQSSIYNCATNAFTLSSVVSAKYFFNKLDSKSIFPILYKPIFGIKGYGIHLFNNIEETMIFIEKYFKTNNDFITFEKFMNYVKEWRVYIVDGEIICSYERQREKGKIVSNLAQGGIALRALDTNKLYQFIDKNLPSHAKIGVYGIDIGQTPSGVFYIIEINRNATGWLKEHSELTGVNFPYEVAKRLSQKTCI